MKRKDVITVLIITILSISVAFNLYALLWKDIERKIHQQAANNVLIAIERQALQTGEVTITTQRGSLTLVQKEQEQKKKGKR